MVVVFFYVHGDVEDGAQDFVGYDFVRFVCFDEVLFMIE